MPQAISSDEAMRDEVPARTVRVVMVADERVRRIGAWCRAEVRCARAAGGSRGASACSSRVSRCGYDGGIRPSSEPSPPPRGSGDDPGRCGRVNCRLSDVATQLEELSDG